MTNQDKVVARIATALGAGTHLSGPGTADLTRVWTEPPFEAALARPGLPDAAIRRLWRSRHGGRATLLLLLVPVDTRVRVLGPTDHSGPIREVDVEGMLTVLHAARTLSRRDAAAYLATELERLDEATIPGLIIRGFLTRHVLSRRLRRSPHWTTLADKASSLRKGRSWRENLSVLGYEVEPGKRGYVLRAKGRPIAVVHPYADPAAFARTTAEGNLPEGILVADCHRHGVRYGVLATDSRFRIHLADAAMGSATGRYLELDLMTTRTDDWPLLGVLAPESLEPGGILDQLILDARRFGNELQREVEVRIRDRVLPQLARALGEQVEVRSRDLADPVVRGEIHDATLTLLFRLLFLLYCEGRGYLPLGGAAYAPHAATTLAHEARGSAVSFDERATTLWDRLHTLVNALRTGNTAWGLPAYDGDLFTPDGLPGAKLLENVALPDARFGPVLVDLAFDPEAEDAEAGIDYADLEVSHLGRIYEGLLALHLSLATEALVFDSDSGRYVPAGRRTFDVQAGQLFFQSSTGGRKAAGVYYTPQVLVRHLIDHALRPALRAHLARITELARTDPEKAATLLFEFRVVDPAMGSAHFLVDALDVMADEIQDFLAVTPLPDVRGLLDELRAEAHHEGVISDGDLLRRLILKRCIYGVDLSPMAVEVAKISLWMASFVPGLSLAYLGHNFRVGNSLIGIADPEALGRDFSLYLHAPQSPLRRALDSAVGIARELAQLSDSNPDQVKRSKALEAELEKTTEGLVRVFNIWCAEAFGVEGGRNALDGSLDAVIDGKVTGRSAAVLRRANEEARRRHFLHWPTAFPEIFWRERPGFDVVIGNPPWEEVTIERLAFFALHDPGLRGLRSEADREKRITAMLKKYPRLAEELEQRQQDTEAERIFYRQGGAYRMQGAGDTDLYKLFCERYGSLTRKSGWLGVVLPRSAFLTDGARGFREWLFSQATVHRLDFILNTGRWAFDAEPRYTSTLLSAERRSPDKETTLALTGPSDSQEEFEKASATAGIPVPLGDLRRWTMTDGSPGYEVPLLPSDPSVRVFGKIRGGARLDAGYRGVWSAFPVRELDETNDRRFFRHSSGVPVWKGRSFNNYDPHGQDPPGFAKEAETLKHLQQKRLSGRGVFVRHFPAKVLKDPKTHPYHHARVAFRDVARSTDSRTVIACLIPPRTFLTNSAPYLAFKIGGAREEAFVLGILNSLPFDWQARRFVETHVNFFVLNLLCFPRREATDIEGIAARAARLSCVDERLAVFANACGVEWGPLTEEDRATLWAETDALACLAWGLDTNDLEVIFENYKEDWLPEAQRVRIKEALRRLASERKGSPASSPASARR